VRQTRFLVSAYRHFERQCADLGVFDEHSLRRRVRDTSAARPWRHAIVAVGDRAFDPHGLFKADWDLLARVPGLDRLDIVATDATVAGAFHERIRDLLPGIDEVRCENEAGGGSPTMLVAAHGCVQSARDREEEVAGFARWTRQAVRSGEISALDRMALVVRQPLPYVYVAREILRSGGIPCQMFDALPLAAEPYSAALDLVVSCVSANFARGPAIALLRSPHLRFDGISARDVGDLDRALSQAGYLGDVDALDRMAVPAAAVLKQVAHALLPLRTAASLAGHLDVLGRFLAAHEQVPGPDDPLRERQLRARGAVLATLTSLREAYARFDPTPLEFDTVAAIVRRWIDGQTFAPRTGESGVHLVDAESARFGDFEAVQLAGLVDGEWPDRPRRNIFYAGGVLRELGWPAEADRLDGARAAFRDLLRLPASYLVASTFTLENDALVAPSTFVDELDTAGLEAVEYTAAATRMFDYERPVADRPHADDPRYRGQTSGHFPAAYSLSALERYQDCPFRFFASDVLRLEEAPEDEPALSPRARGRFIHEVFQRFFEAWDRTGVGTITADRIDEARALFEDVARPLLARMPEADASLEWTRLFGSAISLGIVDVVLGLEASRPVAVKERWLEYRLEGEFALGADGRRVPLKGVADRIDLLDGNRLRVIDYKSGYPPNVKRALQVAVYALCAQERLAERDGRPWQLDEAAYVAFAGKRTLVPVVKTGAKDVAETLGAARQRLVGLVDDITAGSFPPRPHEPMMCTYCAFPSVCRKDYVGDE
jgi:RecB family exonuclease